MASIVDFGLLGDRFSFIFPLLLVFAFAYGVLVFTDPFKGNKGMYGLIAIVLGIMTLFSPIARIAINTMAPWFVLFVVFIVFFLIILKMFNVSDGDLIGTIKSKEYNYIIFWLLGIVGIIVIGSISFAVSQYGGFGSVDTPGENSEGTLNNNLDTQNQQSAFWATITHPKVLGLALLLLIGAATVERMLSTS